MQNTDLTQNCPDELLLWIDNEPYLTVAWRKTLRTGNLAYVKDAIEEMGLSYRKDQWEAVVDEFEDELEAEEKRMQEEADEANAFFLELSNRSN